MCEEKGLVSVAAPGFESPGVVVVHTEDSGVVGKFIAAGTQIAAGVPFMIGEPEGTTTFRIGHLSLHLPVPPFISLYLLSGPPPSASASPSHSHSRVQALALALALKPRPSKP